MKIIKLDRRYARANKFSHALEFTQRECHLRHRVFAPYVKAFRDLYGEDSMYNPEWPTNKSAPFRLFNDNWQWDPQRRRIYFNDPNVMTFVELKVA